MRLFIALELTPVLRDEVAAMARQLHACVRGRFVPPQNYHITLAFIGEAHNGFIDMAKHAIDQGVANLDGIPLCPTQLGKFGRRDNATLWLGFTESPEIMQLANHIREILYDHGIYYESKPFLPHATLARHAKLPKDEMPSLSFPNPARVYRVTLYNSKLSPEGATYEPLYSADALLTK